MGHRSTTLVDMISRGVGLVWFVHAAALVAGCQDIGADGVDAIANGRVRPSTIDPAVPGPSVPGAALPGPSVPGPELPGAAIPGEAACSDGTLPVCEIALVACPAGLVREVRNACFGDCVDPVTCAPPSCTQVFSSNGSQDSQAFHLAEPKIFNTDDIGIELAVSVVNQLAGELGCDPAELQIDPAQSRCGEVVPGRFESEVCFIDAQIGYFVTAQDMLGNVNVVYHRWD